jgi:hypothetical protein
MKFMGEKQREDDSGRNRECGGNQPVTLLVCNIPSIRQWLASPLSELHPAKLRHRHLQLSFQRYG